jgi:steroid Delta-isomerase
VARTAAEAFADHVRLWNSGDRSAWLALFADDVTFDDPVGVPTKHGRGALQTSWDTSQRPDRSWRLDPRRVVLCGDEAAIILDNHGTLDGREVTIESIEVWKINPAGLVSAVRAYFAPDPATHDPYYRPPA